MKFKDGWEKTEFTIEQFVYRNLDGSDYGRGQVETAAATAANTVEAFARLIELLANRSLLSKADVYQIVKGYVPHDEL